MKKNRLKIVCIFIICTLFNLVSFSQTLIPVSNSKGKYGYINSDFDTIIKATYDYASIFSEDLALVKNNLNLKVIDTLGQLYDVSELKYSEKFRFDIGENHSGLPIIIRVWDCAYLNRLGEVVLKVPYQDAESFVDDKAKVYQGDEYNYIDKNGILIDIWEKNYDLNYRSVKMNDKYGYIDYNGKLVIDYQFIEAKDFKDSVAIVGNGVKWAIINIDGKIISDWFDEISEFNGEVAIFSQFKKYGFLNKSGKIVSENYTKITPFINNLYIVNDLEKVGIVNNTGEFITAWYDQIYDFENGFCKVRKAEKFANINKLGAMVMGWYDSIGTYNEGVVKVLNKETYCYVNNKGIPISDWYTYVDDFSDGFAIVKKGNYYGYLNKNGELAIDFQFTKAEKFIQGIAIVEKDSLVAYIGKDGKPIGEWHEKVKYYSKTPPSGLVLLKIGQKYGFQGITGTIIIPCTFDYAENFKENLALVKNNKIEKFIDTKGELQNDFKEDGTLRLDWGNTHTKQPIKIETWECGFINQTGKMVLKLPYTNAYSFENGKAKVENGDKYNYIDTSGNLLYSWIEYEKDYVAVVSDGKFGFVDKNNKLVINYQFDYAYDFKNSKAKIRVGDSKTGKFAIINKTGKQISELYNQISDFNNGVAIVKSDLKFGIIDSTGKLISTWYDEISEFKNNKAIVKLNERYAIITNEGKLLTKLYEKVYPFEEDRARIYNNTRWGFVDETGKLVVETIYESAWDYNNNVAKIKKDGKFGFINLEGVLFTALYERVFSFSEGFAIVVLNNKYGFINGNGDLIIPCIYDKAYAFSGGKAIVIEGDKSFYINKKGIKIKEIGED